MQLKPGYAYYWDYLNLKWDIRHIAAHLKIDARFTGTVTIEGVTCMEFDWSGIRYAQTPSMTSERGDYLDLI